MAELETLQESTLESSRAARADLLIAVPSPLSGEELTAAIGKISDACQSLAAPCQVVLAMPGDAPQETAVDLGRASAAHPIHFAGYAPPATAPGAIPWLANTAAYRTLADLSASLGVRACTILGGDLGISRESLTAEKLILLLDPASEGSFDLAMPLYSSHVFEDLVNKSILYPLTRALFGQRVHNPLGSEFQMSSKLFPAVARTVNSDSAAQQGRLPWVATVAARQGLKICQVRLGTRRPLSADGIELSDALAQLAGPLFVDMEDNAAFWQRIRGSHEVPTFGAAETSPEPAEAIDVRRMVDAFQLGVRNLREVWSLILPPVTLLELKKLSAIPADHFHMEDTLWCRILFDFALAYRLRNIRRAHLFGALTPLYRGWVASYAVEVNRAGIATAQERIEQLARTCESEKPYLLSRWRWPDRFHP